MTDEFKKARDEASSHLVDSELEGDWISNKDRYSFGADWAYEWFTNEILNYGAFREVESEKLEALTKEADALADALENSDNSECAIETYQIIQDALERWRKFNDR